ncbi:hypothetical protein D9M70_444430 [compost metagenome]
MALKGSANRGGSLPPNPTEENLLSILEFAAGGDSVELIAYCNQQFSSVLQTSDAATRVLCAAIYAAGAVLENDQRAWQKFCEDPYWAEVSRPPKLKDQQNALHHAVRRAIGGNDANARKSVSRYSSALRYLKSQKVLASDIPAAIADGGGVEALKRAAAQQKRGETVARLQRPEAVIQVYSHAPKNLFVKGLTGHFKVTMYVRENTGSRLQVRIMGAKKKKNKTV